MGTIACCYTTISGHTVIYSYIILSQQQSKIYPPSNRKCLLDRKQDCQGWVKGGETLIQLPAKVRRGGPHGRVCFYFHLCGSLLHNINCAPPPPIFVTSVACMMINSVRLSPWLHWVRIDGLQRLAIHHHCIGISGICSWSHRMAGGAW